MGTITNFEDMEIWQLARQLNRDVTPILEKLYDRNFIITEELEKLQADCSTLANKIGKFITYLRNSEIKGRKFKNN